MLSWPCGQQTVHRRHVPCFRLPIDSSLALTVIEQTGFNVVVHGNAINIINLCTYKISHQINVRKRVKDATLR